MPQNMSETTENVHISNNVKNNLDVQPDARMQKMKSIQHLERKMTLQQAITVLINGDVHEMSLEDYTAGALAAMPLFREEPPQRRPSPLDVYRL